MKEVVVYTSSTCPYCIAAKDYLNSIGQAFTEKNVSTNAEARKELMAMGYMGVPVVVIDGNEIVGFDKEEIEKQLQE